MKKVKKAVKMLSIAQASHLELTKAEEAKRGILLTSKKAKKVFALLEKENKAGATHSLKGGRFLRFLVKYLFGSIKKGQRVKCTCGSNLVKTLTTSGKVLGYSEVKRDTNILSENKVKQNNRYHFFTVA